VDVHYGDGVAYAFYSRSEVMTISLHENPKMLFPGTGFEDEIGEGEGRGYCVSLPLPAGTFDQAYIHAFDSIALPLIGHKLDVIVFELARIRWPATRCSPVPDEQHIPDIVERLLRFNKPILMTGGGGYNVQNTVRAWARAWTVLSGQDTAHGMEAVMGGIMLQSTDWQGGLRDRELPVTSQQRETVLSAIDASIDIIKATVFPIRGIRPWFGQDQGLPDHPVLSKSIMRAASWLRLRRFHERVMAAPTVSRRPARTKEVA
jgi:acetoin utilization protein AcuC